MAKRKLIAAILIGLMVVAGGFYPLYANLVQSGEGENFVVNLPIPAAPTGEVSFELSADFPQVGDRAMVYKVKPPEVTVEKVTELGRRLGLQGKAESYPEMVSMIDESSGETRWLGVWVASGAVEYGFVGDAFMDKLYPQTAPTLPSEEEAKEIATQFLAQHGLLPPGAYANEVVPGGSSSGPEGEYVTHRWCALLGKSTAFQLPTLSLAFASATGER